MLMEAALVLMMVVGMCCIGCVLYCRILLPGKACDMWAVVWAQGAGEDLEQRVRCLMWLHSCGLLRCAVVIADAGLDEQGRDLAERLLERWPLLTLCSPQQLTHPMEL